MKITQSMLEVYGFTDGCDGCKHSRGRLRDNRPHSEECRSRILSNILSDDSNFGRRMRERVRGELIRAGASTEHLDEQEELTERAEPGAQSEPADREPEHVTVNSQEPNATAGPTDGDLFQDILDEFDDIFEESPGEAAAAAGDAGAGVGLDNSDVEMDAYIEEAIARIELEEERTSAIKESIKSLKRHRFPRNRMLT